MPGGKIRYVPLQPPKDGTTRTSPASEWTIDYDELEKAINPKTKMIVRTPIISSYIAQVLTFPGPQLAVSNGFSILHALLSS